MNRLFNLILFALCGFALWSCKEDTLDLYNGDKSGNNIFFQEKFNKRDTSSMMKPVSLGFASSDLKDSIIAIPIQVTGPVHSVDRAYQIHIADTSSMKEGHYFDFLTEPIIPAGQLADTLFLSLHRKPDLESKRVYLHLTLQANSSFSTNIRTQINRNIEQDILTYRISLDDMFPVSYLWTTFYGKGLVEGYFGVYSRKKAELMMEVLDIPPHLLFVETTNGLSIPQIINWSSYMKYWLAKEKNEGRIYYEDDSKKKEITMGMFAQ